jgi:opacity protein-like surface antigen
VKAEYLFTGLAKTNVFAPPHLINAGANENAVRAGLNYHF